MMNLQDPGYDGIRRLTIGNRSRPRRQAGYQGFDNISGVLGLGFPSITQGFSSNDPSPDRAETQGPYDPVFTSVYKAGLIPLFLVLLLVGRGRLPRSLGCRKGSLH